MKIQPTLMKWLSMAFFFVMTIGFSQQQLNGVVRDTNDQPLPGVSVVVKGSSNGVSTDFNGIFSISGVADADVLVFSHFGFKTQEIVVDNQTSINIQLEEGITKLDDVVVVGYGTKKKVELTGAVAQVPGELTKQNPNANFATALAGRLPGLSVNQTSAEPGRENISILIRGRGTFRDNGVLLVIDGVIGADGLSGLDPQDIESVTVLKDASAAIYGARAANGVILVTTKRGQRGKPTFNYTINSGFSKPTRFAERASALEFALQAKAIEERDAAIPLIRRFTDEEIESYRDPAFRSTDWFREVYNRVSHQTRHNLSLRGGTEVTNYFVSLGTTQREGVINNDNSTDVNQYNFRSNIDIKPLENLKISLNLAGRYDENQFYATDPFTVLRATADGLPIDLAIIDGQPIALAMNAPNPLALVQEEGGYRRENNTLFNSKLGLDYHIKAIPGLIVGGWFATRFNQNYDKRFDRPFIQYILQDDKSLEESQINREIQLIEQYERNLERTSHFRISYEKVFGKHSVNSFLAYEQSQSEFNLTTASRRGFLTAEIDQLAAGSVDTQENGSFANEEARQNYLGRVGYDFDKKYFAQFHFRYDGSFNFPEGNRFGFFPGVELGWRISQEDFFKESSTISNLKLRASWGQLGNDRIAAFQFLNRFAVDGSFPFGTGTLTDNTTVAQVGTVANPNITWETAESINIGIDAAFFENRINFTLDVFKENRNDVLAPRNVSVPDFVGLVLPDENIGKTENKGFEAILGYRDNLGKVGFNAEANFAYAKNTLVFQDAVAPAEPYQNLEGRPIGSVLLYDAIGIYKTQQDLDNFPSAAGAGIGDLIYTDTNGDGEITPNDRIAFERTNIPEITFGLNLGLTYKGFDFNALIQGQANANLQIGAIYGQGDTSYVLRNAYTPDTPNSILPRIGGPESLRNGYNAAEFPSTFWQRDASFVRLRTLQLGYTVPNKPLNSVGISGLRIYLSGSNLLTFDKLKKDGLADPELTDGLAWQIPQQQIFNLGANITF